MPNVQIHFMKNGTPIDVMYEVKEFKRGSQTIDLKTDMIYQGAQWFNQSNFDEILITSRPNGGTKLQNDIIMQGIEIAEIQGVVTEDKEFEVSIPKPWIWQYGDKITVLTKKDEDDLTQEIQLLRGALQRGNMELIKTIFALKSETLSRISHIDKIRLADNQYKYFNDLINAKKMKIKPVLREEMRFVLLNEQVVKVSAFAGDSVIQSEPFDMGDGNISKFEVSLYFSRFHGRWQIVW